MHWKHVWSKLSSTDDSNKNDNQPEKLLKNFLYQEQHYRKKIMEGPRKMPLLSLYIKNKRRKLPTMAKITDLLF